MRKNLLGLFLGLLVGGVALLNVSTVLADQGNTVNGDLHFQDIDIGEDYTYTLPYQVIRAPGGYAANDAFDGQNSLANSVLFGGSGIGFQGQIIPFLIDENGPAAAGGSSWFYPCPIEVSGVGVGPGPTGAAGGGPGGNMEQAVGHEDFPGCQAMIETGETDLPLTDSTAVGLGALQAGGKNRADITFTASLYNFVNQNWVDYNVPTRIPGDEQYESATWSGTLDQDLAGLFEYAGTTGGGGDTGIAPGPSLGITQTLDQGLAYLNGNYSNPFPGGIPDTTIRDLYGNAQRVVQQFVLDDTIGRNATDGVQNREGTADIIHQWIAEWMRSTATNDDTSVGADDIGGGNEDTADGSVTWTLETLLSTSMYDNVADANGADESIHQVNDQYSVYSADWSAGNSVTNNPANAQADLGVGNMVVGHSMSIEFWYAQTNIIPYDLTVQSFTSSPESVSGDFGIHDGDHNPLNN